MAEFHAEVNYEGTDLKDIEEYAVKSVISFSDFVREKGNEKGIIFDQKPLYELLAKFGVK